jgi:hypothetical protein
MSGACAFLRFSLRKSGRFAKHGASQTPTYRLPLPGRQPAGITGSANQNQSVADSGKKEQVYAFLPPPAMTRKPKSKKQLHIAEKRFLGTFFGLKKGTSH